MRSSVKEIQVKRLATKQGAKFEWEDSRTFSIWLPNGKIWNSGYGIGMVTQEKSDDEPWSKFWSDFMSVIDAEVIDEPKK